MCWNLLPVTIDNVFPARMTVLLQVPKLFEFEASISSRSHLIPNSVKIRPNFPILQHRPYRHPVLETLAWLGMGLVWYASIHMIQCKQGSQTGNLSAFAASLSRVFFTPLTNAPLVFLWRLLSTWYINISCINKIAIQDHSGSSFERWNNNVWKHPLNTRKWIEIWVKSGSIQPYIPYSMVSTKSFAEALRAARNSFRQAAMLCSISTVGPCDQQPRSLGKTSVPFYSTWST